MGNIVTVSRAPRLKLINENTIAPWHFYLDMSSGHIYYMTKLGQWNIGLPTVPEWDCSPYKEDDYYEFESAEAMCKWVAGGRKLEDLQGDVKDEWIPVSKLEVGMFAECASRPVMGVGGLGSDYRDYHCIFLDVKDSIEGVSNNFAMVWPLGPGDSITIEPEKP